MPIEIKELVIKTTIDNGDKLAGKGANSGDTAKQLSEIKTQIIDECVFMIMDQLSKIKER